jgi:hypothetical protein
MAGRDPSGPETVGLGKPPRSTRFRPGQSGNPGGRPKLERDVAKLVDKELDAIVVGTGDDGKQVKLTKRQLIAKRLVAEAAKGNLKAIDRIFDLAGKRGTDGNALIGLDPAILASFLRRHDRGLGESGEAA